MSKLVTSAAMYGETENGALTYVTSCSKVLDLFGQGGSLRSRTVGEILTLVDKAYDEDPKKTLEVLFYLRDIRKGQGEKRTFREAIRHLFNTRRDNFKESQEGLFDAIVELGSWKDIFSIFNLEEYASYVKKHWNDKNSLLFKWAPSIGGSSNKTAENLAKYLNLTPRQYRKYLSSKRKELKLVETSMCNKKWDEINYEAVPSRANLIYKEAFKKHDNERYLKFLSEVSKDNRSVKMNAGTLYPYEIVKKYLDVYDRFAWDEDDSIIKVDSSLEALWKNLPDYCNGSNSLVVADTSGSMTGLPMAVSFSLAIYFADRNKGLFADEFITFSRTPKFWHFDKGLSLAKKTKDMKDLNICENTDLQATFELMLKTAIANHLPESEMPKNIYVISDMEFDYATRGVRSTFDRTNFEAIKDMYSEAGYKMPKLVFWNVNSRNDNLPVKADDSGAILVSGCSPSIFQMVIEGETDPYSFMVKTIDRYQAYVDRILK